MKTFSVQIPQPCHEDWDAMTPADRGRFCASCQKTVVDFSEMTDGQLAAFFKKPASSLCGRFHTDQLNRPIALPRKQLPWGNALLRWTWPAFVLFLKSCAERKTLDGIVLEAPRPIPMLPPDTAVVGEVIGDVPRAPAETVDGLTVPHVEPPPAGPVLGKMMIPAREPRLTGDAVMTESLRIDSAASNEAEECTREGRPMDTVEITGGGHIKGRMVAGGVSVVSRVKEIPPLSPLPVTHPSAFRAYPNPVQPGGRLTVQTGGASGTLQLLSVNGAVVATLPVTNNAVTAFTVPANLSPGVYLLQLMTITNKTEVFKIVVNR